MPLSGVALRPRRPSFFAVEVRPEPEMSSGAGLVVPNPGGLGVHLHIPRGLKPGAPLVVVLHGCAQSAQAYAAGAGWLALADRFGFAVLCPEQTSTNNLNRCFSWFRPGDIARGSGEASSINAMVQAVLKEHELDPHRVFVTGLSAGGAMAAVMLATYPEVFAAGAVIAGLPYRSAGSTWVALGEMLRPRTRPGPIWGDKVRDASSHPGPWPAISIWHGASDTTVRPRAGEELVRQWVDVHDVCDDPETAVTAEGRPYQVWRTPNGRRVVELHRIPGMAHGTPIKAGRASATGTAGAFLLDVGIASSLEIARTWGIAPVPGAPTEPGLVMSVIERRQTATATGEGRLTSA